MGKYSQWSTEMWIDAQKKYKKKQIQKFFNSVNFYRKIFSFWDAGFCSLFIYETLSHRFGRRLLHSVPGATVLTLKARSADLLYVKKKTIKKFVFSSLGVFHQSLEVYIFYRKLFVQLQRIFQETLRHIKNLSKVFGQNVKKWMVKMYPYIVLTVLSLFFFLFHQLNLRKPMCRNFILDIVSEDKVRN